MANDSSSVNISPTANAGGTGDADVKNGSNHVEARSPEVSSTPPSKPAASSAAKNPSKAPGKILQAQADPSLVKPKAPIKPGAEAKTILRSTSAAAAGSAASDKALKNRTGNSESTKDQPSKRDKSEGKDRKPASAAPKTSIVGNAGAKSAREELEELERVGALKFMQIAPAALVSIVVHIVLVLILGLILMPPKVKEQLRDILAMPSDLKEDVLEEEQLQVEDPVDIDTTPTDVMAQADSVESSEVEVSEVSDDPAPMAQVELADIGLEQSVTSNLTNEIGSVSGTGVAGRGEGARKALVAAGGGSEGSETAVGLALEWLAQHQNSDGSWSYDHRGGLCQNRCKNHGSLATANNAATGMALLPFLGAGNTHKEGKFKKNVQAGLYYLTSQIKLSQNGGALDEGGGVMYGHGICSIAICEAYAMTHDKALLNPAQAVLRYIEYAQDDVGGGWRYTPNQPGDTSVVGWQLMALKSGHMGYLPIDPRVIKGAENFLNTVQADGGATYGYSNPGNGQATSAIGLLCRMYLGWKHENPALKRGVELISQAGPSGGAMYYNYYATQVMHHYGGELWDKWNSVMRDQLVDSQSKEGHEKGSWYMDGDHGAGVGGRVYCTCMAAMILEVYYRHLPIYQKESTSDEFDE